MQVPYLHHLLVFTLFTSYPKQYHEVRLVFPQLKPVDIVPLQAEPSSLLDPLIQLEKLPQKPWIEWGLARRFDCSDTEDFSLGLRGNRKELDEAFEKLKQAVQKVSAASYIGRLKFSTDPVFGRLIGYGGETIRRLENETKTQIEVSKRNPGTVNITG